MAPAPTTITCLITFHYANIEDTFQYMISRPPTRTCIVLHECRSANEWQKNLFDTPEFIGMLTEMLYSVCL